MYNFFKSSFNIFIFTAIIVVGLLVIAYSQSDSYEESITNKKELAYKKANAWTENNKVKYTNIYCFKYFSEHVCTINTDKQIIELYCAEYNSDCIMFKH